jgi:hypothetical protein
MAVTMVMIPTAKTMPRLIFSIRETFKLQRTRIGTAITIEISGASADEHRVEYLEYLWPSLIPDRTTS